MGCPHQEMDVCQPLLAPSPHPLYSQGQCSCKLSQMEKPLGLIQECLLLQDGKYGFRNEKKQLTDMCISESQYSFIVYYFSHKLTFMFVLLALYFQNKVKVTKSEIKVTISQISA